MTEPREFPEVYYVDIRRSKTRFPWKRPQQWYFVLLVAGNHEPVMTSEMYTNQGDALAEAVKCQGDRVTVFLRQQRSRQSDATQGGAVVSGWLWVVLCVVCEGVGVLIGFGAALAVKR